MHTSSTPPREPLGFAALLVAQFFGAANDNLLKGVLTFMVIDGIWSGHLGEGGQSLVSICFTLPFIVLSGWGGQFTERHGKRRVAIWLKTLELPIAGLALWGTVTHDLWLTLAALFILSCQSAYFGPCKYGMIPDLMGGPRLSRANGTMNLCTNVSAIVATVAAGLIADLYAPKADPGSGDAWLPGYCFMVCALIGVLAIRGIPKTIPGGNATQRYARTPFAVYVETLRSLRGTALLRIVWAWGFFYLIAGLTLLIVPEYTVVLDISREKAGRVLGILAISVGVGSYAAGLIARPGRETKMIVAGGCGLALSLLALAVVPASYTNVSAFIFCGGFSAGFYVIPLQAAIQALAPPERRGQILGTANGVSFMFMTLASAIFWVLRPGFGSQPQQIFAVGALLMLAALGGFFWVLRAKLNPFDAPASPNSNEYR